MSEPVTPAMVLESWARWSRLEGAATALVDALAATDRMHPADREAIGQALGYIGPAVVVLRQRQELAKKMQLADKGAK